MCILKCVHRVKVQKNLPQSDLAKTDTPRKSKETTYADRIY